MEYYKHLYELLLEVGNPKLKKLGKPGKDPRTTTQARQQAVLRDALRKGDKGTAKNIINQLDKDRKKKRRRFYPNQR